MARIIPPGYAECSIEFWLAGYLRPAVITQGVKITGASDGSGNTVADQFDNAFTTPLLALFDANVTVRNAKAVIGQDGGDPIVQVSTNAGPGTSSRESTAPALALMVTKNTALGGRKNRGRNYMPWALADSDVAENGAVNPTRLTSWQTALDTYLDNLEGGAGSLLDGAYILHTDPLTAPTQVTGFSPNPAIRTQRRRQVRF